MTDTPPELRSQVASLCSSIADRAKDIINVRMPEKILALEKFHKDLPQLNVSFEEFRKNIDFGGVKTTDLPLIGKKRARVEMESETKLPPIPCNKTVQAVLEILKKELLDLIDMLNTVKIWIQLNIPRIEDGNNFGVSVQEETVGELGRAESDAFTLMETMAQYYKSRGELVAKLLKYPNIIDYRQAIIEYDEKEYLHLRLCTVDLRNNYTILYDLIHKNRAKLEKPRSSHSQLLY